MTHNNSMKIGLVGFGYWGKILLATLHNLGISNIYIYDEKPIEDHSIAAQYKILSTLKEMHICDKVFIVTPVSSHYNLCQYFLTQGIDVFCEKPLDTDPIRVQELFGMASQNKCCLFVDWLFTLNPAVHKIKELIQERNLQISSIMANRMNLGPVRYDTDAKWDLASHDVSICNYILDSFPNYIKWINFKRSVTSTMYDSSIGLLKYTNTSVQINASWHYPIKDRTYIIDCGSDIIRWDDMSKEIVLNNNNISFDTTPPLSISVKQFLNNTASNYKQTLDITVILDKNK